MKLVRNEMGAFKSNFSPLWLYNNSVEEKIYKVTALMTNI